jgi:hypothetical protein
MIDILFIIILFVLIYFVYKKNNEISQFGNTVLTKEEYINLLSKYIMNIYKMNIQGTRTFSELCKYFYHKDKLFLPTDTIINTTIINNEDMVVDGDCILEDYTEIDNLIVTGSIICEVPQKAFDGSKFTDFDQPVLNSLPPGTIIPWIKRDIPKGWVRCIQYNDNSNINIPNFYISSDTEGPKRGSGLLLSGASESSEVGLQKGKAFWKIELNNLPSHSHNVIVGTTSQDYSTTESYTGFDFNTGGYIEKAGDTNFVMSTRQAPSPGNIVKNDDWPASYVYYIMKI